MTVEERIAVMRAIDRIHFDSEYFVGMDILCELVGWPSLRNVFDDVDEGRRVRRKFNDWVRNIE
jgi:hypothetical protein